MTEMRVSGKHFPWITQDLRKPMQTKDRLRKAAATRKSQFLMDSYRKVRNKVNVLSIQLKKLLFLY